MVLFTHNGEQLTMQKTYLFYDIETSGLNKCFDQVLQFAAIRTDLALKEIERHEILVKLNPDTVLSPQAVVVHHITPKCLQAGLCEYEAMREIHRLLNTPGTISLGYNTLGFDDEFLRFSFYRNLLAPYTHQYANNCSRMDLYPTAAMYYLFKPDGICWPKIDNKSTLKLEHLSLHNNLAQGQAHDAMVDVLATVALAKIMQKDTAMWNYVISCFDKKLDLDRANKNTPVFANYTQGLLIEGSFGADKFYQCPVLGLGMHNHYKNQSLWLRLDGPNIDDKTFVYKKRFGEQPMLLPFNSRFTKYLAQESLELITKNLEWIKNNTLEFNKIVLCHKDYQYPCIPNLDVDAALYQNGFIKDIETQMCNKFHLANLTQKNKLIDQFTNKNLRTQAIRILARNYPEFLSNEFKQEFNDYLQQIELGKILDYKNTLHLTRQNALEQIEVLRNSNNLNELQINLLEELR